ncbi:hypothetical protein ACJMK2_020643 [Sinanodonta woodiana]|uniref:Uncharacterized protein n=1 Tax=Sinanodonta woodiana TaxID=1069815 RepID=A0ABD3U2C0_SINWO
MTVLYIRCEYKKGTQELDISIIPTNELAGTTKVMITLNTMVYHQTKMNKTNTTLRRKKYRRAYNHYKKTVTNTSENNFETTEDLHMSDIPMEMPVEATVKKH